MLEAVPTTLFGVPLAIKRTDARRLTDALATLWERQMSRSLGPLNEDLADMRNLFDPLATGTRLRKVLGSLPPSPVVSSPLLQPPIVIGEDHDRLVTLEGRVVLEVLEELLRRDADVVAISASTVYFAEHRVYEQYRLWGLRKLGDVLRLRAGKGQALPIPSIASLLLLLVNGSISSDTAFRLLPDTELQDRLDEAIGRVVAAFCDALNARLRDPRHFRLYSGYAMTEARRRLPRALGPERNSAYIEEDKRGEVISLIVAELRRPHRSPAAEQVLMAFDRLIAVYREELPVFSALEMAHERRPETRRLRERLEAELGNDRRS